MVIEMLLINDIQLFFCSNDFKLLKTNKCNYVHYWIFFKNKLELFHLNKICRNPTLRQVWGWDSHSQKWELGVLQDSHNLEPDFNVKTLRLEVFFISLKRPWSVNVENGLVWTIRTSIAQVMVEKRAGSQTGSLTTDHKKSGIDPTPVCANKVRHIIGKLLRRARSLVQTSSQSKVLVGSYELPKSQESKPGQFRDSSLGVPGIKTIWMQVRWNNAKNIIWGKVVASLESRPWWVKWIRVTRGLSQHQGCFRRWTNPLVVGFDAGPSN
jgi:hypothetical protein